MTMYNAPAQLWQYVLAGCAAMVVYAALAKVLGAIFWGNGRRSGFATVVAFTVPPLISAVAALYAWHVVFGMYGGVSEPARWAAFETNRDVGAVVAYLPSAGAAAYGVVRGIVLGR